VYDITHDRTVWLLFCRVRVFSDRVSRHEMGSRVRPSARSPTVQNPDSRWLEELRAVSVRVRENERGWIGRRSVSTSHFTLKMWIFDRAKRLCKNVYQGLPLIPQLFLDYPLWRGDRFLILFFYFICLANKITRFNTKQINNVRILYQ